jgi:hypothetical protein
MRNASGGAEGSVAAAATRSRIRRPRLSCPPSGFVSLGFSERGGTAMSRMRTKPCSSAAVTFVVPTAASELEGGSRDQLFEGPEHSCISSAACR